MAKLAIVVPESTVNRCSNPSVERDLTGWASSGLSTFERSTDWQAFGAWAARGVADSVGDQLQAPSFTPDGDYTITARIKVVSGVWKATDGTVEQTGMGPDEHEIELTGSGTSSVRLALEATNVDGTSEVLVDGVQYEDKDHSTTYCDGSQKACTWVAGAHSSTSQRKVTTRAGGKEITFRDIHLTSPATVGGAGMPPLRHVTQKLGLQDADQLQRVIADAMVLTFRTTLQGADLEEFYAHRSELVDAVKPDRVPDSSEPLLLVYDGSGEEREIEAVYLQGLQGSTGAAFVEELTLQFVAYEPRWRKRVDEGVALPTSKDLGDVRGVLQRIDGEWSAFIGGDPTDTTTVVNVVNAVELGPDGKIYVGGDFSDIDGIAGADGIAVYDPEAESWSALSAGLDDGAARRITFDAAGNLYVTGTFTGVDGVANTRGIAKWDGSAWSALGAGCDNGDTDALVVDLDDNVIIGGSFTAVDGGTQARRAAIWDGETWSELGDGFDASVSGGMLHPSGDVYLCGLFANDGPGTTDLVRVAKWDGSTMSQVGNGLDNNTLDIVLGPDGLIYVTGAFENAGETGSGQTLNRIARLEGEAWRPLGEGLNDTGERLAFDDDGLLHVGGDFTEAGGLALASRYALWNGSAWAHAPVDLGTSGGLRAVLPVAGDLYVGFDVTIFAGIETSTVVRTAELATVTNDGSSEGSPILEVIGPGTFSYLRNWTTGDEVLADYTLSSGERLTIDLRRGQKTVESSKHGNVASAVLPGSDLGTFRFAPGENRISVFVQSAGVQEVDYATGQASASSVDVASADVDGLRAGDLLVAAINVDGGSGATITPPAGWTLIDRTDNGTAVGLAIYRKEATSSEPTNWTWTLDTTRNVHALVWAFRGIDTSAPVHSQASSTFSAVTGVDGPAVSPSVDTAVVATFAGEHGSGSQQFWATPNTEVGPTLGSSTGSTAGPLAEALGWRPLASGETLTPRGEFDVDITGVAHTLALVADADAEPEGSAWWRPRHWGV